MINSIARFLLVCASFGAAQVAAACSCSGRPLPELVSDSDDIYVAEVTSVRRVTQQPRHNEQATYEIEVKPLIVFKGQAPESMKLTYTTTYHDKALVLVAAEDESVEHVVTSCDRSYDMGSTFLLLLKRQEPITSVGACTQRAIESPRPALIRAVRELLP
jgi:hypothetical protein